MRRKTTLEFFLSVVLASLTFGASALSANPPARTLATLRHLAEHASLCPVAITDPQQASVAELGTRIQLDLRAHETFGATWEEGTAVFHFDLPDAVSAQVLIYDGTKKTFVAHDCIKLAGGTWAAEVKGIPEKSKYLVRETNARGEVTNHTDVFSRYNVAFAFTHEAGQKTTKASVIWPRPVVHSSPASPTSKKTMKLVEVHIKTYVKDNPKINIVELVRDHLIADLKRIHATHASFLPLEDHMDTEHWEGAYRPDGPFAVDSTHGTPDDYAKAFQMLKDAGFGIILDFVSGHGEVDRESGLWSYYYKDPKLGFHKEYGTGLYDFTQPRVQSLLLSTANYWLSHFPVDGYRVDCLEMILFQQDKKTVNPGGWQYLTRLTETARAANPFAIMIAEDATNNAPQHTTLQVNRDGLGFDFRWNFGLMYALEDVIVDASNGKPNLYRLLEPSVNSDRTINMLTNHDRINALHKHLHPFDRMDGFKNHEWERYRVWLLATAWFYLGEPGRPMLWQGDQFGNRYYGRGWSNDSYLMPEKERAEEPHIFMERFHASLGALLDAEPVFERTDPSSSRNSLVDAERADVLVQVRYGNAKAGTIVLVQNWGAHAFLGSSRYRIPLPYDGKWEVVLNSDEGRYGGQGNRMTLGPVQATPVYESPFSAEITLPPYSTVVLKLTQPK